MGCDSGEHAVAKRHTAATQIGALSRRLHTPTGENTHTYALKAITAMTSETTTLDVHNHARASPTKKESLWMSGAKIVRPISACTDFDKKGMGWT